MTWDRPLRELTGVPEDREEAEELESEPWEEDCWVPLATEEKKQKIIPYVLSYLEVSCSLQVNWRNSDHRIVAFSLINTGVDT